MCVYVHTSLHLKNVHVFDASAFLAYVYLYIYVLHLWRSSEINTCYLLLVYSCAISTPRRVNNSAAFSAAISVLSGTHFTHESSDACKGKVPCPRIEHRNKDPTLRGEKHDISLKILHQAGFETARQTATMAKRHALRPLCFFSVLYERVH